MRLTYMYYLMKSALNDLEHVDIKRFEQGSHFYYGQIEGYSFLVSATKKLRDIELLSENIIKILDDLTFIGIVKDDDSTSIADTQGNRINRHISTIKNKIQPIIKFLELSGFDKEQCGFDIKMPPTNDFNEFADNIHNLQIILQQCPYLNVDGETIEIHSVDIGSVWMRFAVIATSTSIVLSNLATITDKCVKIQSHIIACKQQEEQFRAMKVKNDILESVISNNQILIETLTDNVVVELQTELGKNGKTLSPEEQKKLKFSIEQITKLMDKGMEIYPSIDAPNEVKDIFPTSDEIKSLSEPTKLLEEDTE